MDGHGRSGANFSRSTYQRFTLPSFGKESPSAILVMQFCLDERRKTADDEDPEDNHGRRIENERETKCRSDDAENNERQVRIC
jgi:hypothetical protein